MRVREFIAGRAAGATEGRSRHVQWRSLPLVTTRQQCVNHYVYWSKCKNPVGHRFPDSALTGRCVSFAFQIKTPRVGLEPTTNRLTADCSTIELPRKTFRSILCSPRSSSVNPDDYRDSTIELPRKTFRSILCHNPAISSHSAKKFWQAAPQSPSPAQRAGLLPSPVSRPQPRFAHPAAHRLIPMTIGTLPPVSYRPKQRGCIRLRITTALSRFIVRRGQGCGGHIRGPVQACVRDGVCG